MKNNFIKYILLSLVVLVGFVPTTEAFKAAQLPYKYVKVVGRQLLVDFDRDGVYVPYLIKGVGYSPMPIGRHPSDWGYPPDVSDPRPDNIFDDTNILNRDFALLQAMNANTIRIWKGDDTQTQVDPLRFPVKLTTKLLTLARQHGIKVIPGFWLEPAGYFTCQNNQSLVYITNIDYTNTDVRNNILTRFESYVRTFRNNPNILFWAIGNETDFSLNPNDPVQLNAFYSLINEMGYIVRQVEGKAYHPVAYVAGDNLAQIGENQFGTTDNQVNYVDIWGMNVYRGDNFGVGNGNLFSQYMVKSGKPLWISEFGIDAWHTNNVNNPDNGFQDQSTQALWVGRLWDEIAANTNVTIGGTVMEFSDEWWKPYEWLCGAGSNTCNSSQNHFGHGPRDDSCPADGQDDFIPAFPDQFINEEWLGILKISPHPSDPYGVDVLTPRQVYTTLQNKW